MTQVQHFLCFTSCASRKGARKNKAACRKKDRLVGNKYVDVLFWPLSSFSCTHQTSITHTPHVINCDVAHGFVFCFCLVLDSVKINKACRIKSNQVESSRIKSNQVESSRIKSNQVESSRIKSSIRAFGAHLRTAEHEARTAEETWGIAAAKTATTADKVSSAQSGHIRIPKGIFCRNRLAAVLRGAN